MCGVFGFIGDVDHGDLEAAAKTLAHRGPDAFGVHVDSDHRVFLAHCRLAIIDRASRADQPMSSEDGSVTLCFNGEIYNHGQLRRELVAAGFRFRTTSDTEVILQAYRAWGRACFERLTGMFALAIWDRARSRLLLARDRLGIKPLYLHRSRGMVAFASEAKALLAIPAFPRHIDHRGMISYLMYGYTMGRSTIWNGIERVLPGHWTELDLSANRWTEGQYWDLEPRPQSWDAHDALDRLRELLDQVVSDHLEAEVPLGILLSGGLDSSLVAASAVRMRPGIDAFSIGFSGWDRSEADDARDVAAHLGMRHQLDTLDTASFASPERVLDLFDEPMADTAVFPTVAVCEAARAHATVVLSGDGGDELFGGYLWYLQLEATPVRRRLAYLVETVRRGIGLGRSWPNGIANPTEYHRMLCSPSFSFDEALMLFPWLDRETCMDALEEIARLQSDHRFGRYKRWQLFDARSYLVDNNLARVDRASMAFGLEVRVPLLDHRLVEFAFSLPSTLCIDQGETKVALRRLARERLPTRCSSKSKQGFSTPIHRYWPEADMARTVRGGSLVHQGFIDARGLDRLWNGSRGSHAPYQTWTLAVLEHWCRRWGPGLE